MSLNKRAPIGVFDSGVGGLTVVKEIIRNLPNEDIIYFGDTARVPYGSKSRKTVLGYSRQIVRFLRSQNVKTIVVACNTASALALDALEKEIDIPIIGVVKPGAKAAIDHTVNKRIGVVATESTVNSGLYPRIIKEAEPDAVVICKEAALLCPLVEEGWIEDEITDAIIARYVKELIEEDIDSLILGCTHYPLLRKRFAKIVGENINLVNPAYETALSLKALLEEKGIANDKKESGEYSFYSSDAPERLISFVDRVLKCEVKDSDHVLIEKY